MKKIAVGLILLFGTALAGSPHVAGPDDGGMSIQCELPERLHQKNTGGSDGAGLCVYASARHTGRWQDDRAFDGLFEYMKKHPGGSYPEKFDKTLADYCHGAGLLIPEYVQVQSADLDLLRLACKNGLMPGVTYSYSPTGRYNGQRIAHMVSLVGAFNDWFVVLDNNYIGAGNYEWNPTADFLKSHKGGGGWAIILLRKSPPPVPRRKS